LKGVNTGNEKQKIGPQKKGWQMGERDRKRRTTPRLGTSSRLGRGIVRLGRKEVLLKSRNERNEPSQSSRGKRG